MPRIDQSAEYAIEIQGDPGENVADWFGPLLITARGAGRQPVTLLSGLVTDQAGLIGMIRHLHGLGIVILSMRRVIVEEVDHETV